MAATLVNYHDRGFQVACERPLLVGAKIMLKLPNCYPAWARVRWSLGTNSGCASPSPNITSAGCISSNLSATEKRHRLAQRREERLMRCAFA